jgi:hypothetical protein
MAILSAGAHPKAKLSQLSKNQIERKKLRMFCYLSGESYKETKSGLTEYTETLNKLSTKSLPLA